MCREEGVEEASGDPHWGGESERSKREESRHGRQRKREKQVEVEDQPGLTREERQEKNIAELPGSLAEALQILDGDAVIKDALGPVIYESFQRAKWAEVEEYRTRVTDWEVSRYLETT